MGSGAGPRGLTSGDFNGDGDPDLAVGNVTTDEVKILLGATGITFNDSATVTTGQLDPIFPVAADLDGDGRSDLAVGHASSNVTSVYTVGPGVTFGAPLTFSDNAASDGLASVDIDGDGDPELLNAIHTSSESLLSVRKGAPGGSFFTRALIPVGRDPLSPVGILLAPNSVDPQGLAAVIDNNGRLDVFQVNDYHLALNNPALDSVEVGKISTVAQRVTFTNDGFGPVTPTSIRLTGNANDFIVASDG
jgi:hypothetical protein